MFLNAAQQFDDLLFSPVMQDTSQGIEIAFGQRVLKKVAGYDLDPVGYGRGADNLSGERDG